MSKSTAGHTARLGFCALIAIAATALTVIAGTGGATADSVKGASNVAWSLANTPWD
jgi:hypothetical protein